MDLQFVSVPGFDGDGWSQECRNVTISVLLAKLSTDPTSAAVALSLSQQVCAVLFSIFLYPLRTLCLSSLLSPGHVSASLLSFFTS